MDQGEEYPSVKEIIYLIGMGTLALGSIIMPGLGYAGLAIQKTKRKREWEQRQKEWRKFNLRLLKRNLKRLHSQKDIEIINENGEEVIKLSERGKTKYLKFKLEELSSKGKAWDGKWRLIIYDINKLKKGAQESFRRILKQMKFYPLQESVYLTPYKCDQEIEYLREYFGLREEVIYLVVSNIENEDIYKQYFGL